MNSNFAIHQTTLSNENLIFHLNLKLNLPILEMNSNCSDMLHQYKQQHQTFAEMKLFLNSKMIAGFKFKTQ